MNPAAEATKVIAVTVGLLIACSIYTAFAIWLATIFGGMIGFSIAGILFLAIGWITAYLLFSRFN